MDKYVEEAFWMAMENAVRDRQKDSIRRILDQLGHVQKMETLVKGSLFDRGDRQSSSSNLDAPLASAHRVAAFLAERGLFDRFLRSQSGEFSASDLRKWLKSNGHAAEIGRAMNGWERRLGSAISTHFANVRSQYYRGDVLLGEKRGRYVYVPSTNGYAGNSQLFLETPNV